MALQLPSHGNTRNLQTNRSLAAANHIAQQPRTVTRHIARLSCTSCTSARAAKRRIANKLRTSTRSAIGKARCKAQHSSASSYKSHCTAMHSSTSSYTAHRMSSTDSSTSSYKSYCAAQHGSTSNYKTHSCMTLQIASQGSANSFTTYRMASRAATNRIAQQREQRQGVSTTTHIAS
jgi:hypothetical protein